MVGGDVGTQLHVVDVAHLEERLAWSGKLALLHVLGEDGAMDRRGDDGVVHLVFELRYLCYDATFLSCQAAVVAAYLFRGSGELTLEHHDLVVDVIHLLLVGCVLLHQFFETLALTLQIGDLLLDGSYLSTLAESLALCGRDVGEELLLFEIELEGIDATKLLSHAHVLSLIHMEGNEFASAFGRHDDFCGFKYTRSVILYIVVRASGAKHGCRCRYIECYFLHCFKILIVNYFAVIDGLQ